MSNVNFKLDQVREHFPEFKSSIVDERLMVEYSPLESMHFKNSIPLGMVLATIQQDADKLKEAQQPVKLRGFNKTEVKMYLTDDQILALRHHLDCAVQQTKLNLYEIRNSEKVSEHIKEKRIAKRERMMDAISQVLTAVKEV